jgi:starvation-inducible DNA-binding protein
MTFSKQHRSSKMSTPSFTVPGMTNDAAGEVIAALDQRMTGLIDLALTLKHIHWNVVGPNFIAVHEMLDPQVDAVRAMVDEIAERIATLGGIPVGTPGALVDRRAWDDYDLSRATTQQHLAALDIVYNGVNGDHRSAIAKLGEIDPVSEDLLIGQLGRLELFQWFVRAHLETESGSLPTVDIRTELKAAAAVS